MLLHRRFSSSGDQCGGGVMALRHHLVTLLFTVLLSHRSRDSVMLRQSRVAASSLPRGSRAAAVCKLTVNNAGAAGDSHRRRPLAHCEWEELKGDRVLAAMEVDGALSC